MAVCRSDSLMMLLLYIHTYIQKAIKGGGSGGKKDGSTKELQEEDIEAILAEIRAKDAVKTAVTVTESCAQPSPRANFSLTTLPR